MDPINVPAKFEIRSFTRSWDNRGPGYLKTLGSHWLRPRYFFSKIFNGRLFGWTLWMCQPKLKATALPLPEIIAGIWKKNFGQSLDTPFKVIQGLDFGTNRGNRKRVYDFILVRNSNLGPILHRFGDIASFLRSRVTPPLFRPDFGGVPVAPDGPCWGESEQRPYAIRPWNYFRRIPTYSRYLNVTLRQTDRRTDRRTDSIRWQYRALH